MAIRIEIIECECPREETISLYDEVSRILTDFENPQDLPRNERVGANELYETLVKVQNFMAENIYSA